MTASRDMTLFDRSCFCCSCVHVLQIMSRHSLA